MGHISHGVSQYRGADGTWIHHTSESSGLGGDQIRAIAIREADEDSAESGLTYSRLPYPDDAVDIRQVCFVSAERERVCPPLSEIEGDRAISITYPRSLAPGEKLRFEIVAAPRSPHQLRQGRGDLLSNLGGDDADLFGVWPLIPVGGTVESGQPFTFTDPDNPLIAPQPADGEQETTFTSRWRVWMHTRYAGPAINLNFTVRRP